jgi:membrane protease YdiL (CAAX protease family)
MRWKPNTTGRLVHSLLLVVLRAPILWIFGMSIVASILGTEDIFANTSFTAVVAILALLIILDFGLITQLGLLQLGKISLHDLGWRWEDMSRNVALGILGLFGCMVALSIGYTIAGAPLSDMVSNIVDMPLNQRLSALAIGIIGASLVEETLYRGYLQPALQARLGAVLGIVITAIIFDVLHLNFKPASLVTKFLTGMIFGLLRWKDRSLFAPAIAHGGFWFIVGFS